MAFLPRALVAPSVTPRVAEATVPLRRCTFRKIAVVGTARALPMYDVACTYPDRTNALSLGDVEAARPICEACTYQGIFRPDSD
jgi:hypothetical protein